MDHGFVIPVSVEQSGPIRILFEILFKSKVHTDVICQNVYFDPKQQFLSKLVRNIKKD